MGQENHKDYPSFLKLAKIGEARRLQGGADRSLIILFRYMPLDPAYKAGHASDETGQKFAGVMN
jgi:hypothetical protein